ncbi:MAG: ABC transporter permease [Treponemataceae bacterium]|nr:MAG: ABC transporter permease [Treponemataceae bacterium]
MVRYFCRRTAQSLIILLGVSVIVFALVNLIPGNPYLSMFSPDIPTDQIEAKLRDVGYYDSLPVKYVKWLGRIARGDAGYSIFYREPVMRVIGSRMGNTALLSVAAIFISTTLGIGLGIFSARKRGAFADVGISVTVFIVLSIPTFFFALILIKIFGANLRWLPVSGMHTVYKNYRGLDMAIDVARHMILPAAILGMYNAAAMLRYTRGSVISVLRSLYISAARARGIPERVVVYRHTLKNAMIPIITVLSLQIPSLLSGALITETVFLWPGIGRLSFEAVSNRDYPLVMGILLVMAVITLVSNFAADMCYALIDRRVTIENTRGAE